MKIALDPYMLRHVPLNELPGVVADLDYQYIELSPRDDFLPFFLHPRADKATIAGFRKALGAAGVTVSSVLPLYKWSSPDEDERQAAVRYWEKSEISHAQLTGLMAGGAELEQLAHELEQVGQADAAQELEEEAQELGLTGPAQ